MRTLSTTARRAAFHPFRLIAVLVCAFIIACSSERTRDAPDSLDMTAPEELADLIDISSVESLSPEPRPLEITEDISEIADQENELEPDDSLDESADLDPTDEELTEPCDAGTLTLSVSLCDASFATCEAIADLDPAYLRGEVGLRATIACDPPGPQRLRLSLKGDKDDALPLSAACDDTLGCDLAVDAAQLETLENATLSAGLAWGEDLAASESWTRVLPVFACPVDPEHAFCLRYGEWQDQGMPFSADMLTPIPMHYGENDHIAMGEDGRVVYLRDYTTYVDGQERRALAYAELQGDEWTQRHFIEGKSTVFDEMLLYEAKRSLLVTDEGFELYIAGERNDEASSAPVLAFGSGDELSITPVLDGQTLFECAMPMLIPPPPDRSYFASIDFAKVGGVRHLLYSGTATDGGLNLVHLRESLEGWTCEGLAYEAFDELVSSCIGVNNNPAVTGGGYGGLGIAEAADGSLTLAAGGRGGHVLYAHDAAPLDGELALNAIAPLEGEDGPHCSREQSRLTLMPSWDGSVHVFIEQEDPLAPNNVALPPSNAYPDHTVLRRLRLRDGAVERDENLTSLVARYEQGEPFDNIEGLTPYWGTHSATMDACGRIHGTFMLIKTGYEDIPYVPSAETSPVETDQYYPVAWFTNLNGAWSVEPVPVFGKQKWAKQPKLFTRPDGSQHLFAYLDTTWSGTDLGFRMHHFARPCVEVLVD